MWWLYAAPCSQNSVQMMTHNNKVRIELVTDYGWVSVHTRDHRLEIDKGKRELCAGKDF